MLGKSLVVSSYVIIKEGCPLKVTTEGPDQVQITCGWPPTDAFEMILERGTLRTLVELGTDLLHNVSAVNPDENSTEDPIGQ